MGTPGKDCHIRLSHPAIAGGEGFGFVLDPGRDGRGAVLSIEREAAADGKVQMRVYFNVLLADDVINPDGSQHATPRAQGYERLLAYLECERDVILDTPVGVFSGLGASGHTATELHYAPLSVVACQLNNTGVYYPPADAGRYYASQWEGALGWENSYWR